VSFVWISDFVAKSFSFPDLTFSRILLVDHTQLAGIKVLPSVLFPPEKKIKKSL